MCKPESMGGALCAQHTREPYFIVMSVSLQQSKLGAGIPSKELFQVASRYATTSEGVKRVKADIVLHTADHDLVDVLESSLMKAERTRDINTETKRLIAKNVSSLKNAESKESPRLESTGVVPEPLSWSIEEPIWPNKESTNKAIANLSRNADDTFILQKAFRSLYQDAWRALFLRVGKAPVPPKSNQEGWQWREQATLFATERMVNAKVITADKAESGMTVYNGLGIYTIRSMELVALSLQGRKVKVYRFYYYNLNKNDGDSSPERKFVLIQPGRTFSTSQR